MRLLHTSDWHLGKHLEGFSRIEEQEKFIDFLIDTCDKNNVDVVLVSGDIFDTSNPPSKAEVLYYRALKELSKSGDRLVVIISGNHDSPDRLGASIPLAKELGILISPVPGYEFDYQQVGRFNITDRSKHHIEIDVNGELLRLGLLSYPSESRLNEVFEYEFDEENAQKEYSKRVGEIFSKMDDKFNDSGLNVVMSHIFVIGGSSSDSERPIQLGGGLLVSTDDLPKKADYLALGHLHKPQKLKLQNGIGMYSGSPIHYSRSEIGFSKSVFLMDSINKEELIEIPVPNFKPIEVWKADSIEEAINMCIEGSERDSWVYLEIKTDRIIDVTELKDMKSHKKDILSIVPIFKEVESEISLSEMENKNISELFKEFYVHMNSSEPDSRLMDIFNEIVFEEGEEDETH